jgi:type IV fimbrial biogenesis protein FimT
MNSRHCFWPNFLFLNTGGWRRADRGFTLVELMIACAVMAVLAAIAAPSFSTLIANQRVKGAASDLHMALVKARGEAIKRNTNVKLAPKTAGDWKAGWQIVDPADSARKLEDRAAVKGVLITGPSEVIYQSSGRIKGNTIPSFDISASGTSTHWCGTVDLSGRPYLKKASSC